MIDQRTTVIRGGRVLDATSRRADPADILISGDRILEIGKPGIGAPEDSRVIDADKRLLHPGFVNAHTHGHHGLDKATGEGWTLERGVAVLPWVNADRGHEILKLTAKLAAAEMALKGCTACYDLNLGLPSPSADGTQAIAEGYADVGIRAVIAPMLANRTVFDAVPGLLAALPDDLQRQVSAMTLATVDESVGGLRHALDTWPFDRDQLRLAVAPTIPLHCSDDLLTACGQLAREFDTGLHSHVAESKIQALSGIERYGMTITAHLEQLGLLGPNFTAAHGVWLDGDDMKRLADHGSSVAHCPSSNMLFSNGLANFRGLLDANMNVGIGTDGMRSNDNENIYQEVRLASLVSKVQSPDPADWLTTAEAYHAATAGGAQVLDIDGIGSLEAGAKADIVFLDLEAINWIPLNDPVHQIVHVEDGTSVAAVMAGGRMIVENGALTRIDVSRLAEDVEAARTRMQGLHAMDGESINRVLNAVDAHCATLVRRPYPVNRYAASPDD